MSKRLDEWDHRWQGCSIPVADWHFHRRLFQRYSGFVLPPGAYSRMIKHIRSEHRSAWLLQRRDDRRAIWAVWVADFSKGRLIFVAYDAVKQRAITALPHDARLRKLYDRARATKAAPRRMAEAAGEEIVAAMNRDETEPSTTS